MDEITKELAVAETEILAIQAKISQEVAKFETELSTAQEKQRELRDAIKGAMEEQGVKKFENDFVSLAYIAPTERKSVDITRLKAEDPDIYEQYLKTTVVPAQLRVKVREATA